MKNSIYFHSEDLSFTLENSQRISDWLAMTARNEGRSCGTINFIFCSDKYLLQLNQKYLNHDTLTDIITFNYNEGLHISGDIFISIERVKENAEQRDIEFEHELRRVMIHGILHLIGFDDKAAENQATMRDKEDFYLTLQP